ncbi:hypothetical protein Bca4012_081113 [Brassica carinata]
MSVFLRLINHNRGICPKFEAKSSRFEDMSFHTKRPWNLGRSLIWDYRMRDLFTNHIPSLSQKICFIRFFFSSGFAFSFSLLEYLSSVFYFLVNPVIKTVSPLFCFHKNT